VLETQRRAFPTTSNLEFDIMKRNYLTTTCYTAAIGLAGFSGAVATYGLTKFAPGAELVVSVMGILFEAGKLTSFAVLHRPIPRLLKAGLLVVGLILMALNVAGVSGMLSNAYTQRQLDGEAQHTRETTITATEVADIRTQLAAIDGQLAAARAAVIKARDDKARVKAATAIVDKAQIERDRIAGRLREATQTQAHAQADGITATGEFAAVQFVAGATGASVDATAHVIIAAISAIPDVLAVLLLLAATRQTPPAKPVAQPVRKTTKRKVRVGKRRALGSSPLRLANDNVLPFKPAA
jgi:hypothetical protein